jgi:hypothetical protein
MSNNDTQITTSQTIGPFSHEGWQWAVDFCAAARLETSAPTVVVHGILYDGDGNPIDDAQIEAWLPEAAAAESLQEIPGFRRTPTGKGGEFSLSRRRTGGLRDRIRARTHEAPVHGGLPGGRCHAGPVGHPGAGAGRAA